MQKKLLFFLFVALSNLGLAQDIDFYHKYKNDNYIMPKIDTSMTFEEFKLLSENLRMIDMINAAIVPGYVHFKAKEKKVAYTLVGLRLVSYAAFSAIYFNENIEVSNLKLVLSNNSENENINRYKAIYASAFILATSTYLFDWIRGSYCLTNKQEKIRYQFALKLNAVNYNNGYQDIKTKNIPSFGLSLRF